MRPLAAFALLLVAPALVAAPVPKELRAGPGHIGKWQNVNVDPKNPAVITSRGQLLYFGADGSFTFRDEGASGPAPAPTQRVAFDPKSGHVQHSMIAANEMLRLGVYKIEGDRLTMNLNPSPGKPRPSGFDGGNLWHFQRIEEKK